jgi:hypothetical protein
MQIESLPTEVIVTHPYSCLGSLMLDWTPQPGNYLDIEGECYTVLERHHRYQLRSGRYHLHQISLYVKSAPRPTEQTFIDGKWILGDANCVYNAHSELIRCAVNPEGPCSGCRFFDAQ